MVAAPTSFVVSSGSNTASTSLKVSGKGKVTLTASCNYEKRFQITNSSKGTSVITGYNDVYTSIETISMTFDAGDTVTITGINGQVYNQISATLTWDAL